MKYIAFGLLALVSMIGAVILGIKINTAAHKNNNSGGSRKNYKVYRTGSVDSIKLYRSVVVMYLNGEGDTVDIKYLEPGTDSITCDSALIQPWVGRVKIDTQKGDVLMDNATKNVYNK